MNKEEFKKITEYLDKMVILHQTTGETINKDLDISIRLSVAYEELELENEKLKEVIDKAIKYINHFSKESEVKIYGLPKCKVFIGDIEQLLEILKEVE